MKFAELDLHPEILKAVEKLGYIDTTPIQESAMPLILEGKDVAGLAQTGTGKTAAFVLPLLDRLIRSKHPTPEQLASEDQAQRSFADWKAQEFILVLVPTRELVDQVAIEIDKFRGDFPIRVLTVYGGTGYDKQLEGFKNGVDFVVGTPGRLIDLYKTHAVDFRQVRAIVFDEADRMFDMGFRDDMQFILRRVPKTRQFLVFSATLNFEVMNTAYMHGAEPIECNVSRDQAKAENVTDHIYHCGHFDKPQFLLSHLKKTNSNQVIIFSNFKHNVDRIAQFLNENGYPAVAISSLLTQAQRNRVIEQFKAENHLNILVATDVAARGLDIKGVDMIINFELPDDPENYVHRIGRTGRAGKEGNALSLVGDRDVEALQRIEDYLKHKVSVGWMEDTELVKDFKPFPHGEGRPGRAPPRGGDSRGARGGGRDGPPRDNRGDRGGGDRNRGPRQGGDRDRNRGPRQERPPMDPNQRQDAGAPTQDRNQEPRPHGQHRDRRMGRHNSGPNSAPQGDNRNGAARAPDQRPQGQQQGHPRHTRGPRHEGGRRPDNRPDNRGNNRNFDNRRGPNTSGNRNFKKTAAPSKASIGQKITGFFKGIFGRSS